MTTKRKLKKNQKMNRDISMNVRNVDEESRQVELSFSSEEPYERWFGNEVLCHDDGAMELSRLNEIGCLLFNHDKDKVIGKIEKAWVQEGKGHALVTFDDDDESDAVYQKVKSGTLKGVSVGYRVDSWEEVAAGKVSSNNRHIGPCSIALKWMPFEISIVSVPADASVGVGREFEDEVDRTYEALAIWERQLQLNENYIWGNRK